jgi:predicted small metal-binding protein
MGRKYIDCREFPSESKCSLSIAADSESELLEAAAQHAVAVHGHEDSPQMRAELRKLFHDGTPPLQRRAG